MLGMYPIGGGAIGDGGLVAYTPAPPDLEPGGIDAFLVPAARTVVFEGSIRVVTFEGSKRVVEFP